MNGFFPMTKNGMRNGQLPNGHMTTVLSNQYRDSALDAEVRSHLPSWKRIDGIKTPLTPYGKISMELRST